LGAGRSRAEHPHLRPKLPRARRRPPKRPKACPLPPRRLRPPLSLQLRPRVNLGAGTRSRVRTNSRARNKSWPPPIGSSAPQTLKARPRKPNSTKARLAGGRVRAQGPPNPRAAPQRKTPAPPPARRSRRWCARATRSVASLATTPSVARTPTRLSSAIARAARVAAAAADQVRRRRPNRTRSFGADPSREHAPASKRQRHS